MTALSTLIINHSQLYPLWWDYPQTVTSELAEVAPHQNYTGMTFYQLILTLALIRCRMNGMGLVWETRETKIVLLYHIFCATHKQSSLKGIVWGQYCYLPENFLSERVCLFHFFNHQDRRKRNRTFDLESTFCCWVKYS